MSIEAGIFERGMSKGVVLSQRGTLLKLLRARFGGPPAEISARVQAAEGPLLDLWFERALTGATLAEVFADP